MTDLLITTVADAFVVANKPNRPNGSGKWIIVTANTRRGLIRPHLVNILGRTVLDARLVGRAGSALAAQTFTLSPATEKWIAGRVTWNNQPGIDGARAVSVTIPATPAGGLIEFPVTSHLQAVADGSAWYGWRLATDSTALNQLYSFDSGEPAWELHVTLSDDPEQPTNLRPANGAVSTGRPILAWDFIDFGGESTTQTASRVQVDTPVAGADPDEVAPDFDSGWVVNADPEYNLATSTYVSPGAGPTYWRVTVRDGDGNESEWSEWVDFTVAALPTLVVDTPTGPVGDPQVQVAAHLTGGAVGSWKIDVTGPDRSDLRASSGTRTGAVDWETPLRNAKGRRVLTEHEGGWIHVKVWDTVDRAAAVGENTFVHAWIEVVFTDDGVQVKPTGLTVENIAPGDPRMRWTWSSTDTADAWVLQADDVTIARVDGEDITPSVGVYEWTDNGEVAPLRPHKLEVRAVRGNARSGPSNARNHSHVVEGVWLLPDRGGRAIQLSGTAVSGFAKSDRVATYTPLTGPEIDIVYDWTGRVGTFEGVIDDRQDVWADLTAIEELRTSRNRRARLVWGSQSILVRVKDLDATSSDEILPENLEHVVRFGFVEVGD